MWAMRIRLYRILQYTNAKTNRLITRTACVRTLTHTDPEAHNSAPQTMAYQTVGGHAAKLRKTSWGIAYDEELPAGPPTPTTEAP